MANYAPGPKSAPNRDSFWMRRFSNVCIQVFCAPNAAILLVYIPAKIKMSFFWKDDFLPKLASSVGWSQACIGKRKCIEWSIDFNSWINCTLYGVIPRSLCKIHLNDVSEMFNCWEQWWIEVDGASRTLSATTAIFWDICTVFGFSLFGLSMRIQVSFTFFPKDNEYKELTVLLFFQN